MADRRLNRLQLVHAFARLASQVLIRLNWVQVVGLIGQWILRMALKIACAVVAVYAHIS
jgi:uncharacterized membrane protein (Fun14 family)